MLFKNLMKIIETETSAVEYFINENVLNVEKKYPKCRTLMTLSLLRKCLCCIKRGCNREKSFFNNIFLTGSKVAVDQILYITTSMYMICRYSLLQRLMDILRGCLCIDILSGTVTRR